MSLKNKFSSLFIGLLLIAGCTNNRQKKEEEKNEPAEVKIIKKPASSFSDTLIVDKVTAVFFHPDSVQLDKFRSVSSKMIYESTVHDCFYQMRNARIVLRQYWPKINIAECRNNRFVLFIKSDKSKVFIDLDSRDMCGLLLFDGKKDPQVADMMNIETELEYYFRQHKVTN